MLREFDNNSRVNLLEKISMQLINSSRQLNRNIEPTFIELKNNGKLLHNTWHKNLKKGLLENNKINLEDN
jgi:hypothetical protein